MPITTTWYGDDHHVIVMRYDGKWSWDELNRELTVLIDLAKSVPHDLVILNDLSQTSFVPEGNNLAQGTNFLRNIPEKITLGVFVIHSRLLQALIGTVFSLFPRWRHRIKFVKTLEEGHALVTKIVAANHVPTP